MTCSEFMEGYSDFVDEILPPDLHDEFDAHGASCDSCSRYDEVYRRGRLLLQAFSSVEVDEEFQPRLETRIHQIQNEAAVARTMGSGGSTATVLSIAAVLLVIAWSPLLLFRPYDVELAPILVSSPGPRPLGIRMPDVSIRPASTSPAALDMDADLWGRPNALLLQYSPSLQRYRTRNALTRAVQ